MRNPKIIIAGAFLAFLLAPLGPVSQPVVAEAKTETHGTAEHEASEHEEAHGAEHHAPTPISYYLDWLLVLVVFGIMVQKNYVIYEESKHKAHYEPEDHAGGHGEEHHLPPLRIPLLMVGVVFFLFFFEGFSVLAHYHEPIGLGLVRFAIKFASGVMLMTYGLSFLHEH